jgi:hypothetical protein
MVRPSAGVAGSGAAAAELAALAAVKLKVVWPAAAAAADVAAAAGPPKEMRGWFCGVRGGGQRGRGGRAGRRLRLQAGRRAGEAGRGGGGAGAGTWAVGEPPGDAVPAAALSAASSWGLRPASGPASGSVQKKANACCTAAHMMLGRWLPWYSRTCRTCKAPGRSSGQVAGRGWQAGQGAGFCWPAHRRQGLGRPAAAAPARRGADTPPPERPDGPLAGVGGAVGAHLTAGQQSQPDVRLPPPPRSPLTLRARPHNAHPPAGAHLGLLRQRVVKGHQLQQQGPRAHQPHGAGRRRRRRHHSAHHGAQAPGRGLHRLRLAHQRHRLQGGCGQQVVGGRDGACGGGGGGWGAWAAGAAWVRQATRTATGKSTSHCLLPMAAARQAGPWLSSAWQCAEPRLIAWPPPRAAGCCRCPAAPPPPPPRLPLPRAAGARGWWQGAAAAGQKGQRLRARAARPGQRPAARPVQRPSKGVGVLLLAGVASRRGELQIGLDAEDC